MRGLHSSRRSFVQPCRRSDRAARRGYIVTDLRQRCRSFQFAVQAPTSPCHAEVEAVFKRAAFIVNTKSAVYYRAAGVNSDDVPRKITARPDYLTEEGKRLYVAWKAGDKTLPPDFDQLLAEEATWVDNAIKDQGVGRKPALGLRPSSTDSRSAARKSNYFASLGMLSRCSFTRS